VAVGVSLLCDCLWLGLASLVSCRIRIGWTEGCTLQRAFPSLFLYCDPRATLGLLYRTSPEDWNLESRSFLARSYREMAVAHSWSDAGIVGVFPRLSSIRLHGEPNTLALASRRTNRVLGSDVELQPVWWTALRGVWLARIPASPFAGDNATLGRCNIRWRHVGSVACTALPSNLEQFLTVDIHPDPGRIINTNGICVQFIRMRSNCRDPYALGV